MRRNLLAICACALGLLTLFACAAPSSPPVSNGSPAENYASLLESLRAAGATAEPAGSINQPFFSVEGQAIDVNGENVQVFEYADRAAAEAEAEMISPDGSTIGTTSVSWVGPPHFFQTGRIIVLYVGDNTGVIGLLEGALGGQIAGR